jgi:uncharacterized protein
VEVAVRAKPRSGRNGIEGLVVEADGQTWLVVRVTAVAEDGRANQAVAEELANALGVARSAVSLIAGAASRRKRFRVEGEPALLVAALEEIGR